MSMQLLLTFALVVLAQTAPDAKAPPTGSIQGRVLFKGDVANHKPLLLDTGGHEYCSKVADLKSESVILNQSSDAVTVKNVVVFLEGAPEFRPDTMPGAVLMEIKDCRFAPHVLALHTKQQLMVANRDETRHVIHLLPQTTKDHTVVMHKPNMQISFRVKPEPQPFPIQSDNNTWMVGWIAVFNHPHFSVTGDQGKFSIKNAPPGKYVLQAWHETFGALNQPVEIQPGESLKFDFIFEPKSDVNAKPDTTTP